jgi:hypothetical protein
MSKAKDQKCCLFPQRRCLQKTKCFISSCPRNVLWVKHELTSLFLYMLRNQASFIQRYLDHSQLALWSCVSHGCSFEGRMGSDYGESFVSVQVSIMIWDSELEQFSSSPKQILLARPKWVESLRVCFLLWSKTKLFLFNASGSKSASTFRYSMILRKDKIGKRSVESEHPCCRQCPVSFLTLDFDYQIFSSYPKRLSWCTM